MKRNLINSILILFFSLTLTGNLFICPAAKTVPTYVAIGDSITQGTGMKEKENCFVNQFTKLLQDDIPELTSYNYGKQGDTITDTLTKVREDKELRKRLSNATYISITTGGNDILKIASDTAKNITHTNYRKAKKIPKYIKNENVAKMILLYLQKGSTKEKLNDFLNTFTENYHALLEELIALNPNAIILNQTIYNPASGSEYESLAQAIDYVTVKMNAVISDEVYEQDSERILLTDTYALFKNQAPRYVRIMKDDIHPTKEGHQLIADSLYETLYSPKVKETIASDTKPVTSEESEPISETETDKVSSVTVLLSIGTIAFLILFIRLLREIGRE
ncbi:MAG: hypothetical protein J6D02_02180 [Lachnospira sp.]|nr:hypothetical protein [Lachnospira sp.]